MSIITPTNACTQPYALIGVGRTRKGAKPKTELMWIGSVKVVHGAVRFIRGRIWNGHDWEDYKGAVPADSVFRQWRVPPRELDLKRARAALSSV